MLAPFKEEKKKEPGKVREDEGVEEAKERVILRETNPENK
jgi:hypothetical protein